MALSLFSDFIVVALLIHGCLSAVNVDRPIVKTSTATFIGKRLDIHPHQLPDEYHRTVSTFTRIPYAEPPVGQLRFAAPIAKVIEGDFDATRSTVACPQQRKKYWDIQVENSEDCLTLDIFVPDPQPEDAAVMVWIHGGGYHIGVGSVPVQLPAPLVAYNDVIVVTINYRLGPLGFLATGDGSIPANLGLLDQRQALIWIQDNIKAFGGDPTRVTIFGESAGSVSVNLHLLSTMSAGLFSRAIMQSGAMSSQWTNHPNMSDAVETSRRVAKAVDCDVTTSSETVRCLRKKPVEDLIGIYENLTVTGYPIHLSFLSIPKMIDSMLRGANKLLALCLCIQLGLLNEYFVRPVADGQFLLDDAVKMASKGLFNKADVIIGCNRDEGTKYFIPAQGGTKPLPVNRSTFRQVVSDNLETDYPIILDAAENAFGSENEDEGSMQFIPTHGDARPLPVNQSMFRQVISENLETHDPITLDVAENLFASEDELSNPDASFLSSAAKLMGETMFLCPTFDRAEDLTRAGLSVYTYLMTHAPSSSVLGSVYEWLGATHLEDIPYVFGSPFMARPEDESALIGRFGNEEEVEMSLQIMKYWTNFAKTGDPNLSSKGEEPTGSKYPAWPKSTISEPKYKEISPLFKNHAGTVDAKECYFLKNLLPTLKANTEEIFRLKTLLEEKVKRDSKGSCQSEQDCHDL